MDWVQNFPAPQNCRLLDNPSSSSSMSSSRSESSDTSESISAWSCCCGDEDTDTAQRPPCVCSEGAPLCLCSGLWSTGPSVLLLLLPAEVSSSSSLLPPGGFSCSKIETRWGLHQDFLLEAVPSCHHTHLL